MSGVNAKLVVLVVMASTVSLAPAAAAATRAASTQRVVSRCGGPMTVVAPMRPGESLMAADVGLPSNDPMMAKAARLHVKWLTTISCKLRPGRNPDLTAGSTSGNWSGYDVNQSAAQEAEMEWTIPNTGYPDGNQNAYSSIWPGIGHGTSSTTDELIQDGSEEDATCILAHGNCEAVQHPVYFWVELYPKESQQEVTNLSPAIGDDVETGASYSSGTATFTLCDYTKNTCVDGTQASAPPGAHAEWIVERTTISGSLPPLADYTSAHITYAYYEKSNTEKTVEAGNPFTWTMKSGSDTLSTVGGLNSAGDGFTATWHNYN